MKRGNQFFVRKQYMIATICMIGAILGFFGVFRIVQMERENELKQQIVMEDNNKEKTKVAMENNLEKEEVARASAVIKPRTQTEEEGTEVAQIKEEIEEENVVPTTASVKTDHSKLHFDTKNGLLWPVSGSVILDYSMDQTVYFTTLDQYKYNPAVIISGNVNDKVKVAANGKITEIATNEVTGCTVTMDIGDGYSAIYGQLKEVPYEVGTYLEAGNTLGFVNEPTKYYSLEGSNLYFELQKDGEAVNPIEFFR